MRVFHVPVYSEGPRTILDTADCALAGRAFEVNDPPRHTSITYTDADPATIKREARAARRRRTTAVKRQLGC